MNAYHDLIQARRKEAETEAFRQEMQLRAGIEGTVSEMVRGHGLRRSRYRGQQKNQLQAILVATATNLKRLARGSFLCFFRQSRLWHPSIAPGA